MLMHGRYSRSDAIAPIAATPTTATAQSARKFIKVLARMANL